MSTRERNRYLTTAVVFLLAFGLIGALLFRSVRALAQTYTFRPSAGISNTYGSSIPSTEDVSLAFDANLSTAATTYTNSDFAGDGFGTPDTVFTWSGRWAAFDQTAFFIRQVGLYVVREGHLNDSNQWRIEYSLDGATGTFFTLDDDSISGANPSKDTVSAFTIPDDFDLQSNLVVQTTSRQQDADTAKLWIYDIRVEAEWNPVTGGSEPLRISTTSLPDADMYVAYNELVEAVGGNTPYTWEIISGSLPPHFSSTEPGAPDYNMQITYGGGLPNITTPGTYDFTVQVSDSSSPVQTAQQALQIYIPGLAIYPSNSNLSALVNSAYSVSFTPCLPASPCGTSPYTWCFVSGSIPPGMSFSPSLSICPATTTASSITLSGTPTNAGTYAFVLRLNDSAGGGPVNKTYNFAVTGGTQIIMPTLKKVIKGITYGNSASFPATYTRMEAQNLTAIDVVYSPTWTSNLNTAPLSLGLILSDTTFNSIDKISRTYIAGEIPVDKPGGQYRFSATITNWPGPSNTLNNIPITVLHRKTVIVKSPPSTVHLPADSKLQFSVFAEGGAPSESDDTALDGKSLPYYDYAWLVEPADASSPPLDASYGTAQGPTPNPPYANTPLEMSPANCPTCGTEDSIIFVSGGVPVTGAYNITFWAQDKLSRDNPPDAGGTPPGHPAGTDTNDEYEFIPVTARVKVIAPAGATLERETGRPTKLKQEQYR